MRRSARFSRIHACPRLDLRGVTVAHLSAASRSGKQLSSSLQSAGRADASKIVTAVARSGPTTFEPIATRSEGSGRSTTSAREIPRCSVSRRPVAFDTLGAVALEVAQDDGGVVEFRPTRPAARTPRLRPADVFLLPLLPERSLAWSVTFEHEHPRSRTESRRICSSIPGGPFLDRHRAGAPRSPRSRSRRSSRTSAAVPSRWAENTDRGPGSAGVAVRGSARYAAPRRSRRRAAPTTALTLGARRRRSDTSAASTSSSRPGDPDPGRSPVGADSASGVAWTSPLAGRRPAAGLPTRRPGPAFSSEVGTSGVWPSPCSDTLRS